MSYTAKHLKKQREQTRKQREREAHKADRTRLKTLRQHIRASKRHAVARRREVVRVCKDGRCRAREMAIAIRAQKRAEANREVELVRARSRMRCEASKVEARERSSDSLRRAESALEAERRHQDTLRRYSKPAKLGSETARRRRIDSIEESDSEVVNAIPAELVPVWNAKKRSIAASARRSRAEAFLEWAHDHPADVLAILDRQFQADVDKLVAEERTLRRDVKRPGLYRKLQDHELERRALAYTGSADVPF